MEAIKPVGPGNARDLERFADLVDVLVVNLKEADPHEELGNEHYMSVCAKSWMYENGRWESVETLKEFIIQGAEFQRVASETIREVNTASKRFEQNQNRKG